MQIILVALAFLLIGGVGAGAYVNYSHKKDTAEANLSMKVAADTQQAMTTPEPAMQAKVDVGTSGINAAVGTQVQARSVVVNGVALSMEKITELEAKYKTKIVDGNYWYDGKSGAWGKAGGPVEGYLEANLGIGGALSASASGKSGTGVFINGRELHATDVANLNTLFKAYGATTIPGRYWADASGNFGIEGQTTALGNLMTMVQGLQKSGGGGNSFYYKSNGSDYTNFGGGGGTSYYGSKTTYGPNAGTNSVYVDESGSVEIYTSPKSSDY